MFNVEPLVFLALSAVHLSAAYNVPRAGLSSYAGATTSFAYLPDATMTTPDPNFPDASEVGYPGPTPSTSHNFPLSLDASR